MNLLWVIFWIITAPIQIVIMGVGVWWFYLIEYIRDLVNER